MEEERSRVENQALELGHANIPYLALAFTVDVTTSIRIYNKDPLKTLTHPLLLVHTDALTSVRIWTRYYEKYSHSAFVHAQACVSEFCSYIHT